MVSGLHPRDEEFRIESATNPKSGFFQRMLEKAHAMAVEIRATRTKTLELAQDALRRDDVPTATTALGRVRYYTRFLEEVDAFEEELQS